MSGVTSEQLRKLAEPFGDEDVEWRIGQGGKNAKGLWAKVLCYVSNRAIQQRLDDVCGPENWRNEFLPLANADHTKGCQCGISILIDRGDGTAEWVTKWDGADNTQTEPTKGGMSDAMKRAAVQWGMGRHLYGLGENWANIVPEEQRRTAAYTSKIKLKDGSEEWVAWNPPKLGSITPRKLWGTQPGDGHTSESLKQQIIREVVHARSTKRLDQYEARVDELGADGALEAQDVREIKARISMERGSLESGVKGSTKLYDAKPEAAGV